MSCFLDIGVSRIQPWLVRTPRLRGRRGGSALISRATRQEEIRARLDGLDDVAELNTEAGEIDGVVSLRITDEDRWHEAERVVVRHLRSVMPGVTITARLYHGDSYDEARTQDARQEREWLAPAADWPAGRPCQWCSTWPAIRPIGEDEADDARHGEQDERLKCAECRNRATAAGYATERNPANTPFAERKLVRELFREQGSAGYTPDVPNTFPDLAAVRVHRPGEQPDEEQPDRTHLALIYADGNAIGKFIRGVQANENTRGIDFPRAIDNATWKALVCAVRAIHRPSEDEVLPIIPHLVGGDDVMASVPASRGWTFVRTLLDRFHGSIREQIERLDPSLLPTLSAGVVFHHYTVPLFQTNDLAKSLLRRAKLKTQGKAASVAWHDTTQQGRMRITRPALTHAVLEEHAAALGELAEVNSTARQRLAELNRKHGGDKFDEHVRRVGLGAAVAPFRGEQARIELADALGIARWWRAE